MKLSKLRQATTTRMIRGQTVPRQDTTSFGMRAALKKGGSNYAGDSGEVEGKAARPRLDRPGRKAGGRVCKADGGETRGSDDDKSPPNPGEKSDAEQAKYLRGKQGKGVFDAATHGIMTVGGALGTMAKLGKAVTGLNALSSAANAPLAAMGVANAKRYGDEARKFEGKKRGGSVKRKSKDGEDD